MAGVPSDKYHGHKEHPGDLFIVMTSSSEGDFS